MPQATARGSSAQTAMTSAAARAEPGAEVVTSNQASITSSAAVAAASATARGSRRRSSSPVPPSPAASITSSPIQAVAQADTCAVCGRVIASTAVHGTSAAPATASTVQVLGRRGVPTRGVGRVMAGSFRPGGAVPRV